MTNNTVRSSKTMLITARTSHYERTFGSIDRHHITESRGFCRSRSQGPVPHDSVFIVVKGQLLCFMWCVVYDMEYIVCYILYVICGMWYVVCGM